MKHPDTAFVQSVIKAILAKRRFVEWKLKTISYVSFPSRYDVTCTNNKEEKKVLLVAEFFDDISSNDGPLTRRKVKRLVQKELLPHDTSDDD